MTDVERELLAALKALHGAVDDIDFNEGYCCCGSEVEAHTWGDGHSPVDAGWYYRGRYVTEARLLIDRIERTQDESTDDLA